MMNAKKTLVVNDQIISTKLVGSSPCNCDSGSFRTSYKITSRKLNHNGFILDVKKIMNEIQGRFEHRTLHASCEQLAEGVANSILYFGKSWYADITELTVVVTNKTGHVELTWVQGEQIPEFPNYT